MIPASEEQLAFLSKLQRLFAEGDFTATYKFALLISMADLAVEVGHDDDRPLSLSHRQLAGKFIELYWQQTMPYSQGRGEPGVLSQNNGAQAAIISAIASFRTKHPTATLQSACRLQGFHELRRKVAETVADQPVRYLQNLGGKTDAFLFERERGAIVLKAGVTYCLRRFQPLVQQLARSRWVDHIKGNRRNLPVIGDQGDLEVVPVRDFQTSSQNYRDRSTETQQSVLLLRDSRGRGVRTSITSFHFRFTLGMSSTTSS